jgi:hypothetical protein
MTYTESINKAKNLCNKISECQGFTDYTNYNPSQICFRKNIYNIEKPGKNKCYKKNFI